MDHYKILGVPKNASKEEIKEAFRKLAMQFHPDKHAHSPKHLKDTATLKFKQLSEAYEILTDDRKRSDYNSCRHATSSSSSRNTRYHNPNYNNYGYEYTHNTYYGRSSGRSLLFDSVFVFLNARTLVRTATVAGVLIGGICLVDGGVDALWNTKNSGKSLEDALESIKQAKSVKDKG